MFGGFMWWPKGFAGDENRYYSIMHKDYIQKIKKPNNSEFYISNGNYAIAAYPFEGKIGGIGLNNSANEISKSGKLKNLKPFETKMNILKNGKEIECDGARWQDKYDYPKLNDCMNPMRWIESCNYLQRADFFGLSYKGDDNIIGRLEIAALQDYFILLPELYAHEGETVGVKLSVTSKGFVCERRGDYIILKNTAGEGFVFAPMNTNIKVDFNIDTVTFELSEIPLKTRVFEGFSVAVYPSENVESVSVDVFKNKQLEISARQIFPNDREQEFVFDATYGYLKLDVGNTFGYQYGDLRKEENLRKMDRIVFTVKNTTGKALNVPIMFERSVDDDFNPTGMCPILRDAKTGEPCGIPIRRTNNWHMFSPDKNSVFYAPENDPRRSMQGIWYHGHTVLSIGAKEEITLEYTCTYATWGKGAYPVSHANLTLVGYAGNQQWEQSALACFGESICYDPEVCLGRGNIDDIRPFQMDCKGRCEWTGNIGGGDFLFYYDKDGNHKRLKNMRTYYRAQGPNVTDVTYYGNTIGDAVDAEINVKMGRTNDVVRIWYTLNYTFVKDVDCEKMCFFQIGADNYTSSRHEGLAFGENGKVVYSGKDLGFVSNELKFANGKNPWWFFYDNTSGEKGNLMVTIREFDGVENGKKANICYKIGETNDAYKQACLQLAPENTQISAGSKYKMVLEFIVLPADRGAYYGDAEYLIAFDDYNKPQFALYQAENGAISAKALLGELTGVYPVEIYAEPKNAGVVAELELEGGVGYTPLIFNGVKGNNVSLFTDADGEFKKIDQSLYGNDFWQCEKENDGYRIVFNVKNQTRCRYRLEINKENEG